MPADHTILTTEEKRVERYQELMFEVKRIHRAPKLEAQPTVMGELGTVSKNAEVWYAKLNLLDFFGSAQLSAILGTSRSHSTDSAVPLSSRKLPRHD